MALALDWTSKKHSLQINRNFITAPENVALKDTDASFSNYVENKKVVIDAAQLIFVTAAPAATSNSYYQIGFAWKDNTDAAVDCLDLDAAGNPITKPVLLVFKSAQSESTVSEDKVYLYESEKVTLRIPLTAVELDIRLYDAANNLVNMTANHGTNPILNVKFTEILN